MPRLVGTGFPLLLSFWLFFVRTKDFPQPMERGSDMHRSLYGKAYIQRRLGTLFFFFQEGKQILSVTASRRSWLLCWKC